MFLTHYVQYITPHYENVPFEVPGSWVWTTWEKLVIMANVIMFPLIA